MRIYGLACEAIHEAATVDLGSRNIAIQSRAQELTQIYSCYAVNVQLDTVQAKYRSRGSSGSIVSTTERSGFDPRQGQRIFPLSSVSRPALGPTQPPVQWVPGVLSPGVKARPMRDADHSPPSNDEVENE
jgi:hypothetical protein